MHCQDCAFFVPNTARRLGRGTCTSEKFVSGYAEEREDVPTIPADSVLVEDDEGWAMEVGRLFGCIHFTRRREEKI